MGKKDMLMDFTNKIILVTGASRGIGREIARQFAAHKGTVIVHYNRNRAAAEETLAALPDGKHSSAQADMKDPQALQEMVANIIDRYGRLDILVNNAGVFSGHPLAEIDYDAWQKSWQQILNTNLIGAANLCYCAARAMIKQGGGRIVNVSSRGAFRGEPEAPAYGASKAGLNAMSQSLAQYLAPYNIFVGVVAPGFVETDMAAAHLNSPAGDGIRAQSPLNRVATPAEVAYPVLFLAAEGTEFLTGAIIDVNGASYLRA